MITIFKREVRTAYHSFVGWLVALPLLVIGGIYTWVYCCLRGSGQFEYVLSSLEIVLILLVPVLSMRSVAEERKQRTDQLLYSLPTTMAAVVWGKFLAMMLVLALPLAVLGIYPVALGAFGQMNLAMVFGNMLAYFLLACALTAMGELISACTDNPTVALVLTLLAMLLCYFLGGLAAIVGEANAVAAVVSRLMEALSLFERQVAFRSGIFDLTAVLYYAAATVVFLHLTVQVMEKRRWSR